MSSWKPQQNPEIGQKDPSGSLPVPPAAAGSSSSPTSSSAQPQTQAQSHSHSHSQSTHPGGSVSSIQPNGLQAFSHQQAPVLPPPSAIGNGKFILLCFNDSFFFIVCLVSSTNTNTVHIFPPNVTHQSLQANLICTSSHLYPT